MKKKHRVHKHRWVNGLLETIKHEFETLEEALHFAKSNHEPSVHSVKVYNESDEMVHTTSLQSSTYA